MSPTETRNRTVTTGMCVFCKKPGHVMMSPSQHERYMQWKALRNTATPGTHIQDLLPDLSADEREQLMNGTHGACFDELFPSQEDDA